MIVIRRQVYVVTLMLVLTTSVASALDGAAFAPRSKPLPLTAYDVIQIGKALSDPTSYHLRMVRVKGAVIEVHTLSQGSGCRPPEAYRVMLIDETGVIEIMDKGACGQNRGPLKAASLVEGDRVDALVIVSVPVPSESEHVVLTGVLQWAEHSQD
ncbi:MAG: hypothetical protein Q8S75_15040 [Nitrospirota bacterium]|nr:hypothetical protein [Nitrospirota bacterium]